MEAQVVSALVAGGVALVSATVAVLSLYYTSKVQKEQQQLSRDLEVQKLRLADELEDKRSARAARRDYEYEARKRLYQQCEPLVFQAAELVENASRRIISLARNARRGNIRADGTGWLTPTDYYFKSTAFALLAPTTTTKILQRRLTGVDLALEPRLYVQYELLKNVYMSFTHDFKLAEGSPRLPYDPDRADPGEPGRERLLEDTPSEYQRQGLYFGTLEVIAESMITADSARCISFGEFLADYEDPGSRIHGLIPEFMMLFEGFHPKRLPVLWRVLASQYLQYRLFLSLQREGVWERERVVEIAGSRLNYSTFDWRRPNEEATEEDIHEPFEIGRRYLVDVVRATEDRVPWAA